MTTVDVWQWALIAVALIVAFTALHGVDRIEDKMEDDDDQR